MVINGKELSVSLKTQLAERVAGFAETYGRVPNLVVILVGEDPGSVSYVTGKAKAAAGRRQYDAAKWTGTAGSATQAEQRCEAAAGSEKQCEGADVEHTKFLKEIVPDS